MPTRNVVLTEHQEAFIGELMEHRESMEAAELDCLRGRLDEAERDALAERLVTYAPGLLDRLNEEIEGESAGTGAP